MSVVSLVFLLVALAFVAVQVDGQRDFHGGSASTFPDFRWCRRNCRHPIPFFRRRICFQRCFHFSGGGFLEQPTCGELVLWSWKPAADSCKAIIDRAGIDEEKFKSLNPFYDPELKCDESERTEYRGLMACIKELGVGEEPQPLWCQSFHAVGSEKSCDDVSKLYKDAVNKDIDVGKLNPTANCDALKPGQILCTVRDDTRDLPPPCDQFYAVGSLSAEDADCSDVLKHFVSDTFNLDEYNRLNPDHFCDILHPVKLVLGQMICIREPEAEMITETTTTGASEIPSEMPEKTDSTDAPPMEP